MGSKNVSEHVYTPANGILQAGKTMVFDPLRNVKLRAKKTGDPYQLIRVGKTARLNTGRHTFYFPDTVTREIDDTTDPDYIWITVAKSYVRDSHWSGEVFHLSGAPYKKFDL